MIQVTLPGTGGTQPLPSRALACMAVHTNGASLLIDCGEGTQTRLRQCGISLYKLDAVLLTHYHGDHIFGLPGLLQTMGSQNRTAPLLVAGPVGIGSVSAAMEVMAGPLPFEVQWRELHPDETFAVGPLCVQSIPLQHRVRCLGYKLELPRAGKFDAAKAKEANIPLAYWSLLQSGQSVAGFTPDQVLGSARRGLKLVYATDTSPCEALLNAAQDADLLCMDATYADDADLPKALLYGHSTCRQAGALAAEANVRRLWLTHYSAAVTDTAPGLAAAQEKFAAARAGADGMQEELEFDKV